MDPRFRFNLNYLFIAILDVLLIQMFWADFTQVESVPYSEFEQMLKDGRLQEVAIRGEILDGTLKEAEGKVRHVVTNRVDPPMADHPKAAGVKFYAERQSGLAHDPRSGVVPVLVFFLLWSFAYRRMAEKQGLGGGLKIPLSLRSRRLFSVR
jgi:cell division protease FtsH